MGEQRSELFLCAGHDDDGEHRLRVARDVPVHRCASDPKHAAVGRGCGTQSVCASGGLAATSLQLQSSVPYHLSVVSRHAGLLLNNEMDDFSTPGQPNVYNLPPAKANFIRPGVELHHLGAQVDFMYGLPTSLIEG